MNDSEVERRELRGDPWPWPLGNHWGKKNLECRCEGMQKWCGDKIRQTESTLLAEEVQE